MVFPEVRKEVADGMAVVFANVSAEVLHAFDTGF
jgi:hypothetical protein